MKHIECPLIVDMDGTLIKTDMLFELFLKTIKHNLIKLLFIPFWLFKGRAFLKTTIAQITPFDPKILPYNQELIDWLVDQKKQGRTLILCTASDHTVAQQVANHLGIFDNVFASDGQMNLSGDQKAIYLQQTFGKQAFDYAGNSTRDIPVWRIARQGIVVNASNRLINTVRGICTIRRIFPKKTPHFRDYCKTLRVHQWIKNILLFIPIIAAHHLGNMNHWVNVFCAFMAFNCCASSVYIINDLFDLDSDRLHPVKKNRPFASGLVPIGVGLSLAPLLMILGLSIAHLTHNGFFWWILIYFALTFTYTLKLKRIILIDCLALSFFYTLRILAGAEVTEIPLSFWLLAFSSFFFISLSFLKRYAELKLDEASDIKSTPGRGYFVSDAPIIQLFGVASGYASILLLALYINSEEIVRLYHAPKFFWGVVPVLLFWINWLWIKAHRGEMDQDPIVFAMKDVPSLFMVLLVALLFVFANV